jgi:hypothetical protein
MWAMTAKSIASGSRAFAAAVRPMRPEYFWQARAAMISSSPSGHLG